MVQILLETKMARKYFKVAAKVTVKMIKTKRE